MRCVEDILLGFSAYIVLHLGCSPPWIRGRHEINCRTAASAGWANHSIYMLTGYLNLEQTSEEFKTTYAVHVNLTYYGSDQTW